jgi:carbon-monoxide dehydrogenase medium subunit
VVIAHEFDYRRPTTLEEATRILADHPGSARLLAGGTDLVAWLRDDMIAPDLVIDLKAIPGLDEIRRNDGSLHLGSLVTFTDLMESALVADLVPVLVEMAETVASPGIRNRATLVGNICSAVPSCDAGPVLLALDTVVHVAGPAGERTIPIDEWFVGPRQTALGADEVVSHLTIRLEPHGGCYVKLMRYAGEDLAQAAVGIAALPDHDYRIAFGAVAPTPQRARHIEDVLRGRVLDEAAIAEAVALVRSEINPITDMRATAEYRAHVSEVMLARGLPAAAARLEGAGPAYGTRLI